MSVDELELPRIVKVTTVTDDLVDAALGPEVNNNDASIADENSNFISLSSDKDVEGYLKLTANDLSGLEFIVEEEEGKFLGSKLLYNSVCP